MCVGCWLGVYRVVRNSRLSQNYFHIRGHQIWKTTPRGSSPPSPQWTTSVCIVERFSERVRTRRDICIGRGYKEGVYAITHITSISTHQQLEESVLSVNAVLTRSKTCTITSVYTYHHLPRGNLVSSSLRPARAFTVSAALQGFATLSGVQHALQPHLGSAVPLVVVALVASGCVCGRQLLAYVQPS